MYKFKLELNTIKDNKNLKIKSDGINRELFEQQAYDCWHTYEYLYQIFQYENNCALTFHNGTIPKITICVSTS